MRPIASEWRVLRQVGNNRRCGEYLAGNDEGPVEQRRELGDSEEPSRLHDGVFRQRPSPADGYHCSCARGALAYWSCGSTTLPQQSASFATLRHSAILARAMSRCAVVSRRKARSRNATALISPPSIDNSHQKKAVW